MMLKGINRTQCPRSCFSYRSSWRKASVSTLRRPINPRETYNKTSLCAVGSSGDAKSQPEDLSAKEPAKIAAAEPEAVSSSEASGTDESDQEEALKSQLYSEIMNRRMGTSFTYRHELGLDYNRIIPDIIVGSCLQTAADVDRLAEQENVTTVFCIQEDTDMAYFNLDIKPIQERCRERGDIKHIRFPIHDFDPFDLRLKLPQAVATLAKEHDPRNGTVYIHCTAGMGRAPATALAYMFWVRGVQLDQAFHLLTTLRRCGPKVDAIRSATADMLLKLQPVDVSITVFRPGNAERIQIAGLDVGWHAPVDLERDLKNGRFVLRKKILPGKYQYKFIVDGKWSSSADHPSAMDGYNVNNVLQVIPASMDFDSMQKQMKYLSPGTKLTAEEQSALRMMLCPWAKDESELYLEDDKNALSHMDAMRAEAERVEKQKEEALAKELRTKIALEASQAVKTSTETVAEPTPGVTSEKI